MEKTVLGGLSRRLLLATVAISALSGGARAQEELNALVWCDHTDEAFLKAFTAKTKIKVNVKDYEGTGTALSLIEQGKPGDDVVDAEFEEVKDNK